MFIEYQEGRETMLILYKFSLFNINRSYIVRNYGVAATFLFNLFVLLNKILNFGNYCDLSIKNKQTNV